MLDAFQKIAGGNRRFGVLLEALNRPGPVELKSTLMTLINAMINAVADLEPRVAVRREFLEQELVEEIGVRVCGPRGSSLGNPKRWRSKLTLVRVLACGVWCSAV